jgi:hypothetical protein
MKQDAMSLPRFAPPFRRCVTLSHWWESSGHDRMLHTTSTGARKLFFGVFYLILLLSYSFSARAFASTPNGRRRLKISAKNAISSEGTSEIQTVSACLPRSPLKNRSRDDLSYEFWGEKLSLAHFNMDLQNLALDDPAKAQDALEIMQELHWKDPENPFTVEPDATCYATVIEAHIGVGNVESACSILDYMERISDEAIEGGRCSPLVPTERIYMLVAQGWANCARDDITGHPAIEAEALMRRMQKRKMEPSVKVWSIVVEAWCRRTGTVRAAMQRAESLLEEMEASVDKKVGEREAKRSAVRPNVLTYTSFIGGLARSKDRDLATRAEATLERMERFGVQVDMVAYTSVLNCWSKSVSKRERLQSASRALQILDKMEGMYARGVYHVKPSLITYATAIRAVANSLDPRAPKLAEAILRRMYKLYESGAIENLKPVTTTYNAVLNALSRANGVSRVKFARRTEVLMKEMFKRAEEGERDVMPDVRTWAAVLRAWSTCGQHDAAENAERVLQRLETLHRNGSTTVRPNYVCYTTVMGAWGHSRRQDSLDKMESLLKLMEEGYEKTQEADIRPNTVSYVTAIDAFVRRNDNNAATRAQETVDRMMRLYALGLGHVRPTRIIFNTLIHAWSKSKDREAAKKAEQIFQWMEAQYDAGDYLVRPDEVSLCAVLNAWANNAENGGADRAIQIFNHMEAVSLEKRGFHVSIMMPNIVIKAIARSKDKDSFRKAEAILLKLEGDYERGLTIVQPDVTTYSSVINCCAYYRYAEGRADAFETAMRTFRKVSVLHNASPNNITFGTLFKAITNLLPESEKREQLVEELFDQCCTNGVMDGFVLSQLRNASPRLYRTLVCKTCDQGNSRSGDNIDSILRRLQPEWSQNIVD